MVLTFVFLMGSIAFALLPGEVGEYYFDANQQIFKLKEEIENVKEKGMNANNITHSKDEIITYDSINNKFLLFVRIK